MPKHVTTPHVFESDPHKIRTIKRIAFGWATLREKRAVLIGLVHDSKRHGKEVYREYALTPEMAGTMAEYLQRVADGREQP